MNARPHRYFPAGPVLLGLTVVLGLAVAAITWWLRGGLRDQILRREGAALYAVTVLQQDLERDNLGEFGLAEADERLALLAMQTSRLRGVLSVQLYDAAGQPLETLPVPLPIRPPTEADWLELRALKPVVQFNPAASLEGFDATDRKVAAPMALLQITVPLHSPEAAVFDGAARFVIEGEPIEREFAAVDRHLLWQAGLVWLLASGVSVVGVGWVLGRLARAHAALESRSEDLARANRELALAAKTSALGAVTAHLMHGLRNPLAGLESLMQGQGDDDAPASPGAWREATATTRRLRDMVNEVVALVQEDQSRVRYEVSWREVLEQVAARVTAATAGKKVEVKLWCKAAGMLNNHHAGLTTAILTNLAQNACEAVPASGGRVGLMAQAATGGGVEFRVEDNGPGLPVAVSAGLFEPRLSAKPGGAGIGLAISRQLAVHLGGTLEIVTTGPSGTSFRLVIPDSP